MNKDIEKGIEEFKIFTIEEYNRDERIKDYCKIEYVDETDGNFIQIGYRPQVEKEIFDISSNHLTGIEGLARTITSGEKKYFIENIIKNSISRKIKNSDLTKEFIKRKILELGGNLNEIVILVSIDIKYNILLNNEIIRYDNDEKGFIFDIDTNKKVKVFHALEQDIGNNIIIYNKNDVVWKYKKFEFGSTLNIQINLTSKYVGKYDVIVRSVIKQQFDKEKIIVLNIND